MHLFFFLQLKMIVTECEIRLNAAESNFSRDINIYQKPIAHTDGNRNFKTI